MTPLTPRTPPLALMLSIGLLALSACSKKPAEEATGATPPAAPTAETLATNLPPNTPNSPNPSAEAARDPAVLPLLRDMAQWAQRRFEQGCTHQAEGSASAAEGAGPMAITPAGTVTWPGSEPLDWLNRASATVALGYDAQQKVVFIDFQWPEGSSAQARWTARAINKPGEPYTFTVTDTGAQPTFSTSCHAGAPPSVAPDALWQLLAQHIGSAEAKLNCFGSGSASTPKPMDLRFDREGVFFGEYRVPVRDATAQSAVLGVDPNSAAELGLVRYSMALGAGAEPTMLGFAPDKSLIAASFQDPETRERWTCMRPR